MTERDPRECATSAAFGEHEQRGLRLDRGCSRQQARCHALQCQGECSGASSAQRRGCKVVREVSSTILRA